MRSSPCSRAPASRAYVVDTGTREQCDHLVGGVRAGLHVRAVGDRGQRHQSGQVVETAGQQLAHLRLDLTLDLLDFARVHVSCSRYSGSICHHVGQSWS